MLDLSAAESPMSMRSSFRFSSVKIVIGFVIWSILWVLVAEAILHIAIHAPAEIWGIDSLKSLLYVLVTAPMLYAFLRAREREEMESRRITEVRLKRLSQSNLIAICYWQESGEITDANDAFLQLVGYTREELRAGRLNWHRITPPEWVAQDRLALKRLAAGEKHVTVEKEYLRKDMVRVPVIVGETLLGAPSGDGIAFALDATELRNAQRRNWELEDQLRQAQKLEAIGQLASGLAHDLNNLINIVIGYATLIKARLQPEDANQENAIQILKASERASDMIKKLLAFGKKQRFNAEVLDLNAILQDLSNLVEDALGKGIKLRLQLSPQILPVQGDRGQLEQVFLNLVVNARDAMPNGGTLTISTENIKESGVSLRFSDTGVGMSPATKARIFDPFFTTKSAGVGTGLGLSTVYGIIGQFAGKITVRSELGQGTEFEIYLPRAPQLTLAEPSLTYPRRPEQKETTILLVEDEADLRDLLSKILQDNHYRVLEAGDGEQALRIANRSPTRIDLVLTDLIMPGLSGYDVAQKIRDIRPGTKIMYITGYGDGKKQFHRLQRDERLLQKPVHPEQLLSSIREMLSTATELKKVS